MSPAWRIACSPAETLGLPAEEGHECQKLVLFEALIPFSVAYKQMPMAVSRDRPERGRDPSIGAEPVRIGRQPATNNRISYI
jgi:hypothetical protein